MACGFGVAPSPSANNLSLQVADCIETRKITSTCGFFYVGVCIQQSMAMYPQKGYVLGVSTNTPKKSTPK